MTWSVGGEPFIDFLERHPLTWERLLNVLPDGVAFVDDTGIIRHANAVFTTLTGYDLPDLVGRSIEDIVPPNARARHVDQRRRFVEGARVRTMGRHLDLALLRRDGSELAVDIALAPIVLGGRPWIITLVRDDSAERSASRARDEIEQRFRLAFEENMAPMAFTDLDDHCIAVNDAFCSMVARTREELLAGDSSLFTHPEDLGITESVQQRLLAGDVERVRYIKRYLRSDGRVIVVEISKSTARDEHGDILYFVNSERDITDELELADQLAHQALHDPLTGLANRALFDDRLAQAFERVDRYGGFGAVLLIDLDDFKGINDTRGHIAGDELLSTVAGRMQSVTRASDTLCRFGGDEFLYLAEGLSADEEVQQVATRLLGVFDETFAMSGTVVEQRASIGVVTFDGGRVDRETLVRDADVALYEAKREGKNRYVVFTPTMHHRAASHFELARELRHALAADELGMHYQPIVELSTLTVVGFEALMRWRHPERGFVSPSVFIPLAEESGLIVELGAFALREAIATAATWASDGPYLTVNLSARQFHDPDLVAAIERELKSSGFAPDRLIIEVTESATLSDVAETLGVIERLTRLGIGIALDDFGTGYSSLHYLTLVHPRIIKIDQSFVSPTHDDLRTRTLLEAIVTLGQKLDVEVLAEGIETDEQLAHLRRLGCDLGQGFLFSPAVSAPEVAAMAERRFGP
ncbi:MAG: putative bifunctional diguanylate cyclase/phosphodiesterase [Acidimicrobiales bacterium]